MRLTEWLKALFVDQFEDTRAAVDALSELRDTLNAIVDRINSGQSDGVQEITGFCRAISAVQDSDFVTQAITELSPYSKYERLVDRLDVLNAHLHETGRRPYTMNRTARGEEITDDVIFLGNYRGWRTMTVAFAKQTKESDPDYYAAMERQATTVMRAHIPLILQIIGELQAAFPIDD